MSERLADLDVSELVRAVNVNDCATARTWIERNKQNLSDQELQDASHTSARRLIGKIVRAAALGGQVPKVEFFMRYAFLNERGEEINQWTALHCAVMGITRYDQSQQFAKHRVIANLSPAQDKQLQIIYLLHEAGVDVTVESGSGVTPIAMALDPSVDFKIGAVLLEKLQKIQNEGVPSQINEIPTYKKCLQTLLQWATTMEYRKLVNELLKDPSYVDKDLVEGCLKVNSNNSTLFHVVAETGNSDLFKQLMYASKLSPGDIANCRSTHHLCGDSTWGIDDQKIFQTPVSVAIGKKNIRILKTIHTLNERLHTLTCLNLSNVCITSVPEEILTFSGLKELDLSNNELGDLPLNDDIIYNIVIENLNLSQNRFESVPNKLFDLSMLKSLNISSNALAVVPTNWWKASKLQELDLSNNKITAIGMEPLYDIYGDLFQQTDAVTSISVHTPAVSHVHSRLQQRISLHDVNTGSPNTSDQSSLVDLRLNKNLLESFPRGLACLTPKLERLHLESNKITDLCSIKELPPQLQNLNISHNSISSDGFPIFHAGDTPLYCFRVSNHSYSSCNHMDHEILSNLAYLNCSHNEFAELYLFYESQNLFFPNLISLDLSFNKFTNLPRKLDQFTQLKYLYVDNNPSVIHIPRDIGYLSNLTEFKYDNIADPLMETLNNIPHVSDKLAYLRSIQQSSEKNSMINVMIVGPSGHGKSTLLSHLKSMDKASSQPVTYFDRQMSYATKTCIQPSHPICKGASYHTVGITIDCFALNDVKFITWDFSGQEEYFSTHQCFIMPGSVYVVCCQAKILFRSGISMLLPWLAMIKAKAPGSPVLIIATFCDQLPNKTLRQCNRLRTCIMNQLSTSDASVSVEIKDIVFMESIKKKQPCIANLQKKLYEMALTVKVPSGSHWPKRNHQNLLDQLVPIAYLKFQERLFAEAAHIRRHLSEKQPVLTWAQLEKLASDVCDEKELHGAVEHMKRNGMIIHFDVEGLQQFYFIDPQWLIDKLASVVSTPNISILSDFTGQYTQHPEIISIQNLMERLSNRMFLPAFQEIFCRLLFHFEVAIPINKSDLFFPSLLMTHSKFHYFNLSHSFPRNINLEKTIDELKNKYSGNLVAVEHGLVGPINIILYPTGLCYRRFFVLTVVPASIWPKLISRCLTDFKFLEIVKKNCLNTLSFQSLQDVGKTRVGNSVLEWIYWKNGIELRLSDKTLLQISNVDLTGCNKEIENIPLHARIKDMYIHNGDEWLRLSSDYTGGLEVTVPECILISKGDSPAAIKISEHTSSQIFTHSIEVINEIFMEWFSCTNTGSSIQAVGEYLISFTPCPICVGDKDKRTQATVNALTFSRTHTSSIRSSIRSGCSINQVLSDFQSTTRHSSNTSTRTHSSTKKSKKSVFDGERSEVIVQANKFVFDDFNTAKQAIGESLVGFSTMHCLWIAKDQDYMCCPKHDKLELQYLTPDLVCVDVKDFIILKRRLQTESSQPVRQGGFGKVSRKKLMSKQDISLFEATVAVKVLADHGMHTPKIILEQYCDNRRELNMIYGLEHPSIVKFYGITVHPVGFVMEWAGMGSLDDIIKQHQSQRQYICPDSVFAVTLQVVSGLQYLHKNSIVHFDIKPQNILICSFPHENHCCYSKYNREVTSLRCIHCSKTGELDGVVTKIADLGISVRKGPRGFLRKMATPCHTAPEVLLHRGKQHLSEKVDMFSLGICMYETMSCTMVPPKNSSMFEFEKELKNGNRPKFSDNVPRYPALLYDCMTSCWDQDPHIRPSATQLLDALCFTKLQLIDFFVFNDYKITDVQCCCKVFNEESGKEQLWLAVKEQSGGSSIIVIKFQENGNKVMPQITKPRDLCFEERVLKICQLQQFVYIILKGIKIVIVHSQSHEHLSTDQNPFNSTSTVTGDPCAVCCVQKMGLLLVTFTSGDIGIMSLPQNQFNSVEICSAFQYEVISLIAGRSTHFCSLGIKGYLLCMEVVTIDESTNDLWCGCNNNTIIILSLQSLSIVKTPVISQTIRNVSGATHISSKVLQLKMVNTHKTRCVCALLDVGDVVCYDAVSKDCLKRISASTAIVMLPCNNKLYLGTRSGQILSLNINSIITDGATNEKPLVCGKHKVDQPVFDLLTVTGELSPHSFLEGFGNVHCKPNNKPCKVMLSIGGGYTEFFSCSEAAITISPNDLCIISFRV